MSYLPHVLVLITSSSPRQYIKLPVLGTFNIPAAVNASASAKIIPSHPLAAMISTVTGRNSSCSVTVELYAACPTVRLSQLSSFPPLIALSAHEALLTRKHEIRSPTQRTDPARSKSRWRSRGTTICVPVVWASVTANIHKQTLRTRLRVRQQDGLLPPIHENCFIGQRLGSGIS